MTVSTGIANDYQDRIGKTPDVVTNAPFRRALAPSEVSNPIRLLHMGVADERRRLEDTIEAVQMLDGRFSLDLVLMRDNSYRRRLEALVAGDQLIRILPPVRQEEMLEFANQYDVGVFLLPARFPNQVHVLPNKLFDYIQARLAVAIGPSHEMAEVVRRWDCGVISDDFRPDSLAEALSKLTLAEVRRMKANADVAAGALNAEANQEVVLGVVAAALR
jgi:glycosyltransferase involved in cell wall biosynthesis